MAFTVVSYLIVLSPITDMSPRTLVNILLILNLFYCGINTFINMGVCVVREMVSVCASHSGVRKEGSQCSPALAPRRLDRSVGANIWRSFLCQPRKVLW